MSNAIDPLTIPCPNPNCAAKALEGCRRLVGSQSGRAGTIMQHSFHARRRRLAREGIVCPYQSDVNGHMLPSCFCTPEQQRDCAEDI